MLRKILSLTLSISLLFQYSGFAQSINLADYLSQGHNSVALDRFRPLALRYFSYEPSADNFKILLDKGDQKDLSDIKIKDEADKLLTYFKIGLSLPNEKFWVNLRPDAEDQIIDPELEKTDLGKVLLAADLQLKKDTSSLTSPQSKEGKAYWDKLYKKAGELFGTENITIPTITRPWIVPGEIIVRESKESAYIYKAVLKVMLEEDYLNNQKTEKPNNSASPAGRQKTDDYNFSDPRLKELNRYSTDLIKETILPELTKRINSSKDYASLRQVFFSLILARWFKDAFSSSGRVSAPENSYVKLINSQDLTNLTSKESWSKTAYFNEYKKSFAQGEYNLSEKIHTPTGQAIRRYTSGGMFDLMNGERHSYNLGIANSSIATPHRNMVEIDVSGNLKVGSPLVKDKEFEEGLSGINLFDFIEKAFEGKGSDFDRSGNQRVVKLKTDIDIAGVACETLEVSRYQQTVKGNGVKYRTIEFFAKESSSEYELQIKVYNDGRIEALSRGTISDDERLIITAVIRKIFKAKSLIILEDLFQRAGLNYNLVKQAIQNRQGANDGYVDFDPATSTKIDRIKLELNTVAVNKVDKVDDGVAINIYDGLNDKKGKYWMSSYIYPSDKMFAILSDRLKDILPAMENANKIQIDVVDMVFRALGQEHSDDYLKFRGRFLAALNATKFSLAIEKTTDIATDIKSALAELMKRINDKRENHDKAIFIPGKTYEGAAVLDNGNLLLPNSSYFPNAGNVPEEEFILPRYVKIVPLANNFFSYYLGKGEFQYLTDRLLKTRVILSRSGDLGPRHYKVDRDSNTISVELNFMEFLSQMGRKRITLGLFAQALTELDTNADKINIDQHTVVNRIAQVSKATGNRNRLEDAIKLFNLKKEIRAQKRRLTDQEKKFWLIDQMECTRSFNGRRAAVALTEEFGYFGSATAEEAETLLREVARENPDIIVVNEYKSPPEGEDPADKFKDRTAFFLMKGDYLADQDLIKERSIVSDFELDARDAALFGGKAAYTGMLQHAPGAITFSCFATSGEAFKEKLIKANPGYDEMFKDFADSLHSEIDAGIKNIEKELKGQIGAEAVKIQDITKHRDYNRTFLELSKKYAKKYQDMLEWDKTAISGDLVVEMRNNLRKMAERLGISVRLLILAIRSSALGEDSETASFAGRQDSSLFVMILKMLKVLGDAGVNLGSLQGKIDNLEITVTRSKFSETDQEIIRRLIARGILKEKSPQEAVLSAKQALTEKDIEEIAWGDVTKNNVNDLWRNLQELKIWKYLEVIVEAMRQAGIPVYIDEAKWGKSVEPWNAVLQALVNKLKEQDKKLPPASDEELDVFVKEWLANQRSLFNARSIDYRLRQNPPLPVYSNEVKMSSLFQLMGVFDIGTVGFGVNRATGMPEITMGLIEGATNAIVSNTGTPDNIFINLKGEVNKYGIAPARRGRQVPNFLNIPVMEDGKETVKGTLTLESFEGLEGQAVTTDLQFVRNAGITGKIMSEYMGMYPDFEGGFTIRRGEDGRPLYLKDLSQPDGIARDHAGNPRYQWIFSYTQVRPETRFNLKDKGAIILRYKDISDEDLEKLRAEGKILYENPAYHSQGAVAGAVVWAFKERPEDWVKVFGKIMVAREGTPDMDPAMHMALAIITLIGSSQSHTAIMAQEFDWIVITGLPDMNKLYPGRVVTVLASRGIILDGDYSHKLKSMGNDFRPSDLPELPSGFRVGLNVADSGRAQQSRSLANYPSFSGQGLVRLEMLLRDIGIMAEGAARYDNYLYHQYLTKLEKEGLTVQEQSWLTQALGFHGEVGHLKPHIKDRSVIFRKGNVEVELTPQTFYKQYLLDEENPPYDPANEEDAGQIAIFNKMTAGWLNAEERYETILFNGLAAIAETARVSPDVIMNLAQRIQDGELQESAMRLAELYKEARNQLSGAVDGLPEDPVFYVNELKSLYRIANKDSDRYLLSLMIDLMKKKTYIRIDDRKSDEQQQVPGSRVEVDKNPMSGYRGLRMTLDNPRAAKMQLRAIKKMVDRGQDIVSIFGPVVYDEKHFVKLVALAKEAGLDLSRVEVGIMTETPQSIEIRPFLEAGIRFTSTGGNDLLQFSKAVDRMMMGAPHLQAFNNRAVSIIRMLATLANETRRWNAEKGLMDTEKKVTSGFCGDWPSNDPVGALILYVLGFDSVSLTLPKIERTVNTIFTIFDRLYGHEVIEGYKVLKLPKDANGKEDREQIARNLLNMIDTPDAFKGLPKDILKILPALKTALAERGYNIYDEINPNAAPGINNQPYEANSMSLSEQRKTLPFHYRLFEDFDNGKLHVRSTRNELMDIYVDVKANVDKLIKEYNELVKRSIMGEDISREKMKDLSSKISSWVDKLNQVRQDIESLIFKKKIENFLRKEKALLSSLGKGKQYYIDTLYARMKEKAKTALSRNQAFFIETPNELSDIWRKKSGAHRYELEEERNPELGNRGMARNLNPDRGIFMWELEAVARLLHDEEIEKLLKNNPSAGIFLVPRTIREVDEVKVLRELLRNTGVNDEELSLALPLDTADMQYYFDKFLDNNPYGVGAFVMSAEQQRQAAMLKRATEWGNINTQRLGKEPLITDADAVKSLKDVTVPIVLTMGERYGLPVYWPDNAPLNMEKYRGVSSSLENITALEAGPFGGIDLTQMNMLIQPQGGFASSSLDFSLPELSKAEIEAFDLDKELELIQRMASSGIDPIDERLKKYLAVCFARGRTGKEIDDFKLCLEDVFIAQQLDARQTPEGYKEVIVIADTRRFVLKESRLAASKGNIVNLN